MRDLLTVLESMGTCSSVHSPEESSQFLPVGVVRIVRDHILDSGSHLDDRFGAGGGSDEHGYLLNK